MKVGTPDGKENEMNAITKVRATLIRSRLDDRTFKSLPSETLEIEADDEDALLGLFFREYVNRYKYCNTESYSLQDPALAARYRVWISDIANYAKHGGDMW